MASNDNDKAGQGRREIRQIALDVYLRLFTFHRRSAITRNVRGLTCSVNALITPPLSAPSRPSKMAQIFFCSRLTHSWG